MTKVSTIITNARTILQETSVDGTRWTKTELLAWLNEAYSFIVLQAPEANAITEPLTLVAGTKQQLPIGGAKLIDVYRNLDGDQRSISVIERDVLNLCDRGWNNSAKSIVQEHFVFDENNPKLFYVYPAALAGSSIEIAYGQVPVSHSIENIDTDDIEFDDRYAPVITDYVLFRAFMKDSDAAPNADRSNNHYRLVMTALGVKIKNDMRISPNK